MNSNSGFTKLLYTGLVATSMTLAGCGGGGGGGDDVKAPENFAPTVSIFGANRGTERTSITLEANAEDIDGTIASYEWSVTDSSIVLNNANSQKVNFMTPSVDIETTFTVSVTVTDDDGATKTQSLEVTSEPIYSSLEITGRVIDKPLDYIDIALTIGDLEFTTWNGQTDSKGNYFIEMNVEERYFDELVKITATGNEEKHTGVKLVSVLGSFNKLKDLAGRDELLVRGELFAVNVTNFSTAQYILAEALDSASEIQNQQQLEQAYAQLTFSDVVDLAAAIKVIVDNEQYSLPVGSADTYEFASDENAVIAYNAQLPVGVLEAAKFDTMASPDLVENPDFDSDGIADHLDDDIDNDGIAGDLDNDSGNSDGVKDYFPRNPDLYAPTVGMVKDTFFLSDSTFSDTKINLLYNCLNQHISSVNANLPEDERKTLNDSSVLIFEDLSCSLLKSLQGIEYFTNLTGLDANSSAINDISYLAGLTKLKRLNISGVAATDFSTLTNLTALTNLNVSNTSGFYLSDISEQASLTKLDISQTQFENASQLAVLVSLNELNASQNNIIDASPLTALTELTLLNLSSNSINVLPDFSLLTKLTSVGLNNNAIDDIDSLQYLVNIGPVLDLSNNAINDILPLTTLTQLTELNLANNSIVDATALTSLTNLMTLNLANNSLNTINNGELDLGYASAMKEFYLSNNNLTVMPGFSAFTSLEKLELASNGLLSLDGFTELSTLVKLNVSSNALTSVAPLDTWTILPSELVISGNSNITCDASLVTFIDNAETQGVNLTIDDLGECVVIEEPTISETVTNLNIARLEIFNIAALEGYGASTQGKTGRTTNLIATTGETDYCLFKGDMHQPVCWTHVSGTMTCDGVQGESIYTCKSVPEGLYPVLTVDVKFGRQPDGKFVSSFTGRSILNVLSINNRERTISCSAVDVETQKSTCTFTSPLIQGAGITWQQDHTFTVAPQCRGVEGEHIAICTPAASTIEADPKPAIDSPFNAADNEFYLDLSTFTFIDRETGEEEECDPQVGNCPG